VVRHARRSAALTQSYYSADIGTNARRPWRDLDRRAACVSQKRIELASRLQIVGMAMTIVRNFDRPHSTPHGALM
jgi:hypothetical protein